MKINMKTSGKFKSVLRVEIIKSVKNKYFFISLCFMSLLALLSASYAISNLLDDTTVKRLFFSNEVMISNEIFPVLTSFNYWIGGDSMSLVYALFYTLIPVFSMLPYGWSYCSESKTGYIRNVVSRTSRFYYYCAKSIAIFFSGSLTVSIPLILNFLVTAAFFPSTAPQINYLYYNHVMFSNLWVDFYYDLPYLYIALYIFLNALFGGLIALFGYAISFYIKRKFAVILFPFLFFLLFDYISDILCTRTQYMGIIREYSPIKYLHSSIIRGETFWWIVLLEGVVLFSFSLFLIYKNGKHHEIF